MRRTKIIGTIGPASNSKKVIKDLILNGLDVIRLNMSHGTQEDHKRNIETIRSLEKELNIPITILLDLQGPKIRTGVLEGGHLTLHAGGEIIITTNDLVGNGNVIPTNYKNLVKDVRTGDRILLDDGLIELKVKSVNKAEVKCQVVNGGILKDHKGINIPGVKISAPNLTEKDKSDLNFGIENDVDYIAISFVKSADDIRAVKKIINSKNKNIPVIAKIEKPEAVKNINKIIAASDAILVARGDLGVEMSPEKVPIIQKEIIKKCNYFGKPVITATQMLESMVVNPRPTRAEASDVANAVYDETDALMLSEEVAVGKYPVESVKTMSRIIEEIEKTIYTLEHEVKGNTIKKTVASSVSHAACHTAEELNAEAIITFTSSGSTSLLVSKFKPDVPIYAVTMTQKILRRVRLYFGVTPVLTGKFKNMDEMIQKAEKILIDQKAAKIGDLVVLTAGLPINIAGTTNLINVHQIGQKLDLSSKIN